MLKQFEELLFCFVFAAFKDCTSLRYLYSRQKTETKHEIFMQKKSLTLK